MKSLLAICLVAIAPALALAQTTTTAKPAAKKAAKTTPTKKAAAATAARQAIEESTPIEEPDPTVKLSEADLAMAKRVYTGEIPCELGAHVKVTPLRREGFFLVVNKLNRFVMHPVESRTGAIRLEDPERGALWLQLGNKSMLMSQKQGQRLADECQSPEQAAFADNLKKNPMPSILEPAPAASAAKPASN